MGDKDELIANIIEYLREFYKSEEVVGTKYQDAENSFFLPCGLIDIVYGTNGMCAGNTKEEAIAQGLCEIIERHIIRQIIENKIVLVNITDKVFDIYRRANEYIEILEFNPSIKVYIFQCISEFNIPVFALLYVNKNKGAYIVKIGVHPNYKIAIDRCFTELLQGKEEHNIWGLSNVCDCDDWSQKNLEQIYRNGSGNYPFAIFEYIKNTGNPLEYIKEMSSSKEIYDYLVNEFKRNGYKVLMTDVSRYGFFAYHIIVPGLSEVIDYETLKKNIPKYLSTVRLIDFIKKTSKEMISHEEIEEFYQLLLNYKNYMYVPLSQIMVGECDLKREECEKIKLNDYMVFCLSSLNKTNELMENIERYIVNVRGRESFFEGRTSEYFLCLLAILKSKDKQIDNFQLCFDEELLQRVKSDLDGNFIKYCKIPTCSSCPKENSRGCRVYMDTMFLDNILLEKKV